MRSPGSSTGASSSGGCEEAIDSGHRGDGQHVLCYLDLDRFKLVNDTSGHLAGDSMLREVAKLLRDAVRDSDTVARLGGDEFGMLLIGCPLEKARQIADDVCRSVGDYRFVWKDKHLQHRRVASGWSRSRARAARIEELLAAADSACYVAKKQGTGRVAVYSARDEALARHTGEIQWLQRLQSALKENRFQLYHQTIVPAHGDDDGPGDGGAGAAAATRRGKELAPAEFMRAAERYRLMGLVDRWVVQTTLAALGRGAIALHRQPQRRDQHLRPDARRPAVPRVRGRVPRQHRSRARRRCASRSPRAPWSPTSSRRGASSACCTAWAASSRSMISAPASARSPT